MAGLGDIISRLSVELGMNTAAFEKGATIAEKRMAQTQKKFAKLGDKMSSIGANLSLAVSAPLAAFAAKGVKEAQETAAAMAQVEAALASMGPVAGKSAGELEKAANAFEKSSLFEGDVILKDVTANLLTFGNVSGDVFDRAQQGALDMATRLGKEPREATLQLGKALNDPIKGVAALGEAGVQFSEKQKAMITAMVETGRVGEAQAIIMGEVEKQFGGAAQAAQNADPFNKFNDAMNGLAETVGTKLLPLMVPMIDKIAAAVEWFGKLPGPVKDVALVVGGLAAAAGPVVYVAGGLVRSFGDLLPLLKKLGPVVGILGKALLFIAANPAILAIAAVVGGIYLAWKHWDKIEPIITAVGDAISSWWNENVKPVLDSVMGAVKAVADFFRDYFGAQIKGTIDIVSNLLSGDFSGAWQAAKDMVSNMVGAMLRLVENFAPGVVGKMRELYQGVKTWLQDKLGAVFDWLKGKLATVRDAFQWLGDQLVFNSIVPDMVDGIAAQMARLDSVMVAPALAAVRKVNAAFAGMAGVPSGMAGATPGLGGAGRLAALGGAPTAENDNGGEQGLISNAERWQTVLQEVGSTFGGVAGQIADMIASVINPAVDSSIDKFSQMQEAMKGMTGLLQSIFGKKAGGILGGILNVGLSLGKAFGGFRAAGGPISAGRAYMVGERGPELVVPRHNGHVMANSELRGGGMQRVEIVDTTGLFRFKVNGQIMEAAPAIASGGARLAGHQAQFARSRRLA